MFDPGGAEYFSTEISQPGGVLKSLITRFVFEGLQPINLSQLGFQIKGLFQFQIKLQSASSVLRLDFVIRTPHDPGNLISVGD